MLYKLVVILTIVTNTNSQKTELIRDLYKNEQNSLSIVYYGCNTIDMLEVLKVLTKQNHYVIVTNNFDNLFYHDPHNKLVFIVDLACNESANIIATANTQQFFASPYRWLLINNDDRKLEAVDCMVDSDVTYAKLENNSNYGLYKIYKEQCDDVMIIYEHFATWYDNGEIISDDDFVGSAAIRRQNLHKAALRACLVITHNDTYKHLTDKREKHIDTIAKVNYVFMEHISDLLNATMNYSVEPTWGYVDDNSNWNGMIGELTTRRADIGGTPLFMTSDRVSIIDYIAMTTPTRSKFVFRQPKLSYITNVFVLPFNSSVWISSIALVVLISLALFMVIKWEWYKKRNYNVNDDEKVEAELRDSFADVMLVAHAAVCQQGTNVVPYNIAGRLITILLYISLMFLYTSYSANIVALLQSSSTSIQTLSDLLHSRLQVGVDDTVFNRFYFPNASEPVRRALYLQKVIPLGQLPRYFQIDEGVRRMREGLFAFHMETGAGYKIRASWRDIIYWYDVLKMHERFSLTGKTCDATTLALEIPHSECGCEVSNSIASNRFMIYFGNYLMQNGPVNRLLVVKTNKLEISKYGETFTEDEKCGLQEIQFLQVSDPWLAVQKNSSYKEMLRIGLRKIHESGLQQREVSLLYTKKPICSSRGSSFIGVGIVDCYLAAAVLAGGLILAFGIFIAEILHRKINNDRTKNV